MELVRQSVPDRNSSVLSQSLYDTLIKTSVFDAVKHTSKDTCRILNTFLVSHLTSGRIQISHIHSEVMSGNFKGTACSRGCLLKKQGYILAL